MPGLPWKAVPFYNLHLLQAFYMVYFSQNSCNFPWQDFSSCPDWGQGCSAPVQRVPWSCLLPPLLISPLESAADLSWLITPYLLLQTLFPLLTYPIPSRCEPRWRIKAFHPSHCLFPYWFQNSLLIARRNYIFCACFIGHKNFWIFTLSSHFYHHYYFFEHIHLLTSDFQFVTARKKKSYFIRRTCRWVLSWSKSEYPHINASDYSNQWQ